MNTSQYQPGVLDRLLAIAAPEIARYLDPGVKKSFRSFQPWNGKSRGVETTSGTRVVTGVLEGIGRVADVFHHSDGSVEATFAHGKFSSWLVDGSVEHDWMPTLDGHAPLVLAPSYRVLRDFLDSSFAIRLLPVVSNARRATPLLKRAALVHYKILTTDEEGREGVAVAIARA